MTKKRLDPEPGQGLTSGLRRKQLKVPNCDTGPACLVSAVSAREGFRGMVTVRAKHPIHDVQQTA